jgi:hypothetical protein
MTQQTRSELQRLLSALCDGQLTEAHDGRLEMLLREDAACRRLYLEYIHFNVDLEYLHHQTRLAGRRGPFATGMTPFGEAHAPAGALQRATPL